MVIGLRHGLELFSRRFPGPIVIASGTGGGTGSSRSSYYSTTSVSGMLLELYNTATLSHGSQFGQWIFPPGQEILYTFQNVTGDGYYKYGQTNHRTLLSKLWTSAILRDNIVTALGYVLYRPKNTLPEPLYTSLYLIYNYVRLRRIHTCDYVHILREISNAPPQTQFLILFQELAKSLPKYLRGTAEIWFESLILNKVNLTDIFRPNGGPIIVDLLATLNPTALEILHEEVRFSKNAITGSSQAIKDLMGNLFASVFAGIKDGSIKLTQHLFALILLHLPLDRIVPQADEIERYIVDGLRLEIVKHWDKVIGNLRAEHFNCPFILSQQVLKEIAKDSEIDDQFRRNIVYMIPYINLPTNTFTNPYYNTISEVLGDPTIQYKNLLQLVTAENYPDDVLEMKNRFISYVNQGYISMDMVAAGFIRHDYTNPIDLLVAILTRIIERLSYLSDEILSTVKAFKQALIFNSLLCSMSPDIPDGYIYIPALAESFDTPNMPEDVRSISKKLSLELMNINFDWYSLTNKMTIDQCTSPKQCFIAMMKEAVKYLPNNSPAIEHFEELLLMVNSLGRPELDVSKCESIAGSFTEKRIKDKSSTHKEVFSKNSQIPTQNKSKTNDHNTTPTTPTVLSPLDAKFPPFTLNMYYLPVTFEQRELLLPPTVPSSADDLLLKPIRDFINREDLLEILGNDFDATKYTNKAWLLRGILEKAVTLEVVKNDMPLYTLMRRYLNFLIHEMEVRKPEINFATLLETLPHATNETELKYFQIIKNFFVSGNFKKYLSDFDANKFKTRGDLMKELLLHLLQIEELKTEKKLYEAIKYYADNVYLNGFGARSIEYTIISQKVIRRAIDLQSAFQAIDVNRLDKIGKKALNGVYNFFAKEFEPRKHLSDFEMMDFKTKGEWLQAFFHHLIELPSINQDKKRHMKIILPYIVLTGPGAESVDSIINSSVVQ